MYRIAYPKLDAILKMPNNTWEKELALVKDDHWLVETWKMGLNHMREVLERVLHEVELDLEWVIEHRTDTEYYLK